MPKLAVVGSIPTLGTRADITKNYQKTFQFVERTTLKNEKEVAMKKEDLMKIEGMTEELASAVEKASIEEFKNYVSKARFDEVNEAKKNAESLLKERDSQLEELKKTSKGSEELMAQIESLQNANKQAKTEYESNIKAMQIDNAVTKALMGAKAKNIVAVKSLIKDLDKAELDEKGEVKGLKEQIDALVKSDSYLFGSDTKISGAKPASSPDGSAGAITKEQFNKMSYDQRVELFNTNRDAYDALTK